jgi:hypothetical protein
MTEEPRDSHIFVRINLTFLSEVRDFSFKLRLIYPLSFFRVVSMTRPSEQRDSANILIPRVFVKLKSAEFDAMAID